jgi:hypothetical protein
MRTIAIRDLPLVLIVGGSASLLTQNCVADDRNIHNNPDCLITNSCPKIITGVNPAFGESGIVVTVSANTSLANADTVYFGTTPAAGFTVNNDGTLAVSVPSLPPGSSVPISVLVKSQPGESTEAINHPINGLPCVVTNSCSNTMLYGTATYSVPLASMWMVGPLTYYGGDTDWFSSNGPQNHGFTFPPPLNLLYGSWPTFHVSTLLQNTSLARPETKGPPYIYGVSNVGNAAKFSTQLQICDIGAISGIGPCTNWDGSGGYWVNENKLNTTLSLTSDTRDAKADMAIEVGPPILSQMDLARTFRLSLNLAADDSYNANAVANRFDSAVSQPFTAIVAPNAYLQVKVLPLTIVYAAPGNTSVVSFSTHSTYNTNYNLGSSNTQTNKDTTDASGSLNYMGKSGLEGGSNGLKANLDFSEGNGETWDTQASTSVAIQNGKGTTGGAIQGIAVGYTIKGNPLAVPGDGQVCASATNCSTLIQAPNWFANLPFWSDQFILQIHPQYAFYAFGPGVSRTVLYRAVPAIAAPTVLQLWECATGQTPYGISECKIQYSDANLGSINGSHPVFEGSTGTVILAADEAANLLELDPFYQSMGQHPNLDATRAALISSTAYGSSLIGSTTDTPLTVSVDNTQNQGSTTSGKTTYTTTVSNSRSDTTEINLGYSYSLIASFGLSGKYSTNDKETNEVTTQTEFSDSTAVSSAIVTTASVTLDDVSNQTLGASGSPTCKPCHDPLPQKPTVNIYLDKTFGGFMFVDSAAPNISPDQFKTTAASFNLAAMDLAQEQRIERFLDVPDSLTQKAAIGIMARLSVMSGFGDGTFRPSAALTREQLAEMLASGLNLRLASGPTNFSDVPASNPLAPAVAAAAKAGLLLARSATELGANDPVSRQEMATSLARAFKVTTSPGTQPPSDITEAASWASDSIRSVIAAGYMANFADGTFKPTTATSRAVAAQAMLAALSPHRQ